MTTQKQVSRRRFLAGTAAVSVVALGGLSYAAVRQPPLEFAEGSLNGPAGTGKILVAYASQYGSTGGIAYAAGQALYKTGVPVDVLRVENVTDISQYQAAIIGAPVISNEWMAPATAFVQTYKAALAAIPVAYFLSCMTLGISTNPDDLTLIDKVFETVQEKIPEVEPVELGLFAGALDYNKMSSLNQALYRLFSPDDSDGDYRDFTAIEAWATALRPRLEQR